MNVMKRGHRQTSGRSLLLSGGMHRRDDHYDGNRGQNDSHITSRKIQFLQSGNRDELLME